MRVDDGPCEPRLIVVPLDGSTLVEAALPWALDWAEPPRTHPGGFPETHPTGVWGTAVSIHDVPRWRWADALEEFSRGHRGWLASVVTVGPGPVLMSHTELNPLASVTVA